MRSLGGVPDVERDTLTITGETVNLLIEHLAARADWEKEAIACMKSRGVIPTTY